jgi:hypothetical protein
MISKERLEKRLASLPAKSGHARVLRRKIAKLYPDAPVAEAVVEPVVVEEKKPRKKRVKKSLDQ